MIDAREHPWRSSSNGRVSCAIAGVLACAVFALGETCARADEAPSKPAAASQPDAAKPEAAKADAAKPEAAKADAKADATKAEEQPLDAAKADAEGGDDAPVDPKKPPAWETAKPERRGGFAMGLAIGAGFGASNGFPNDPREIGYSAYYTESGIGFAPGGVLWIGGAPGDWVNFGFCGGYSTIFANGTKSPAPVAGFHADLFPLYGLGKAWRDLGAMFDFGMTFPKTTDENDKVLVDGGMSSYLFAGAFWEGLIVGHLKMGPYLGLNYIFSDSERRTLMQVGWRFSIYSQP